MKTVIMAGGLGKRAESFSDMLPKPLIPVNGKPVLQYETECLVRQDFTDIIFTVSHMAEKIQAYFGDGSKFGCRISYYHEPQPLGNAGALFRLWEMGVLDGDFLLLNADSVFDVDLHRFAAFHTENGALASIFTHPSNHPYDSGLIVSDNGVVRQWLMKEDTRPQWYKNRVNAGLHIINTGLLLLSGIKTIDADHKADLDRDILKPLVSTGRIYAYDSPEYVKDMGTPERFAQVKSDILSGRAGPGNTGRPRKAVFLDRDGTINRYVGFLRDIEQFELIDGVAEAIRRINDSGYLVIVVTNQPVIARGEVTVGQLNTIHNKMETLLGNEGAYIDALYYCPHHPDKGFEGEVAELKTDCDCRKPKPGMLLQAAKELNIDLKSSWMVGDSWDDVQAGINAGCMTALIRSGRIEMDNNENVNPLIYADSLSDFVKRIQVSPGQFPAYTAR